MTRVPETLSNAFVEPIDAAFEPLWRMQYDNAAREMAGHDDAAKFVGSQALRLASRTIRQEHTRVRTRSRLLAQRASEVHARSSRRPGAVPAPLGKPSAPIAPMLRPQIDRILTETRSDKIPSQQWLFRLITESTSASYETPTIGAHADFSVVYAGMDPEQKLWSELDAHEIHIRNGMLETEGDPTIDLSLLMLAKNAPLAG
jgi:hypothetical protein